MRSNIWQHSEPSSPALGLRTEPASSTVANCKGKLSAGPFKVPNHKHWLMSAFLYVITFNPVSLFEEARKETTELRKATKLNWWKKKTDSFTVYNFKKMGIGRGGAEFSQCVFHLRKGEIYYRGYLQWQKVNGHWGQHKLNVSYLSSLQVLQLFFWISDVAKSRLNMNTRNNFERHNKWCLRKTERS